MWARRFGACRLGLKLGLPMEGVQSTDRHWQLRWTRRGGGKSGAKRAKARMRWKGPIRRTIPAQPRLEPLSADRFGVRFTADTEFRDGLDAPNQAGHASWRTPTGTPCPVATTAKSRVRAALAC